MSIFLFGLFAGIMTFLGGFSALHFSRKSKDTLHLMVSVTAGAILVLAVIGLPGEAIELLGNTKLALMLILAGFLLYLILDRSFVLHSHSHEAGHEHRAVHRSSFRASTMVIHSLIDGIAIGLAAKADIGLLIPVGIAVIAHDFSDGLNTVSAVLKDGSRRKALLFLILDSIVPIIGIVLAYYVLSVPDKVLGGILAVIAGFFLYISASDIIPETFHNHPKTFTTVATVAGVVLMGVLVQFVK